MRGRNRSEVVNNFFKSRIIEVLSTDKKPLNCKQITKRTGISKSVIYKCLSELVSTNSIKQTKKSKTHYYEVGLGANHSPLPSTIHQYGVLPASTFESILEKFKNFSNEMTMEIINLIEVKSSERANEKANELALEKIMKYFLTSMEDVRGAFPTHNEVKVGVPPVEVPL